MLSKDELLLEASIMMDAKIKPLDRRLRSLERIQDKALIARLQQNRDACNTAICHQYRCDDEYARYTQDDMDNPKKVVVEITIDFKH